MFNEKLTESPTIRPNWRCDQLNFPKIATPSHMLLSCDTDVPPMRLGWLRTLSFNMSSLIRLPFNKHNMVEVSDVGWLPRRGHKSQYSRPLAHTVWMLSQAPCCKEAQATGSGPAPAKISAKSQQERQTCEGGSSQVIPGFQLAQVTPGEQRLAVSTHLADLWAK